VAAGDNELTGGKQGDVLEGAVFEIYDSNNQLVETLTTGKDGLAVSKALDLRVYGILEVKAPENYVPYEKMFYAELKIQDDLVKFRVLNKTLRLAVSVEKKGPEEAKSGESIVYEFSNIKNGSNASLEEFYWHELLPTDFVRLEKIQTGKWSESVKMELQIRTNLDKNYRSAAKNLDSQTNSEIDCANFGLKDGEFVTEFRLVFGTVQPDFHEMESPKVQTKVLDTIENEKPFVNKTDVGGRYGKNWVYATSSWVVVAYSQAKGDLPKTGR
jgi:uncharacterized surface anchored protein